MGFNGNNTVRLIVTVSGKVHGDDQEELDKAAGEQCQGVQGRVCHPDGQTDKPKKRSAGTTLGQEERRTHRPGVLKAEAGGSHAQPGGKTKALTET